MHNFEYNYKTFDITSNSRLDKLKNCYFNCYGYNYESNNKLNLENKKYLTFTNQNSVKTKEYNGKK